MSQTTVEFSQNEWTFIDRVIEEHRDIDGSLIPVLEAIQDRVGYLPESIQRRVAVGLNLPLSRVYGVVTFYSFFTMRPRGKHQIRVCLGTACHVKGGQRIAEELAGKLGIGIDECTPDRQFSLHVVRCLGACGPAPVMLIDDDLHKEVKPAQLDRILKEYR